MKLEEKFATARNGFYDISETFFTKIAELFGYPNNPGMSTIQNLSDEAYSRSRFFDSLPTREPSWPVVQRPENWFEMIFGPAPKAETVTRYIYENKEEGFYNFYIQNYKNLFFLPDKVSEFIQIKLNICLDLSVLETLREVIFLGLVIYTQIISLRIALAWFIYINPYTIPWCYVSAAVDWIEDVLNGLLPSVIGVNVSGSVFLGAIGIVADGLNHLIFTMPFLPSEGVPTKLLIDEEMKNVLIFHYLPILWYRYPIPNEIREFWYKERPDILNYLQEAYKDVDIQFLPDSIIKGVNTQILLTDISSSTKILLTNNLSQTDKLLDNLNVLNEHLNNFI